VKTNLLADQTAGRGVLINTPNPIEEATIASDALAAVSATGQYRASPKLHPMTVEEAVEVWRNEGDPN
jgi:hypothetical protein